MFNDNVKAPDDGFLTSRGYFCSHFRLCKAVWLSGRAFKY